MSQTRTKPLLFCDIDGVISLWGFSGEGCPTGDWRTVEGMPHFLSTHAAAHLLALQSDFDVVWCSGWEEKANEHLPHWLGTGPYPYVRLDAAPGAGRPGSGVRAHWKLDAVEALAAGRPLAWVDDAFNAACHGWAAQRRAPTLLVPTEPATGLGDAEAALLRAFARRTLLGPPRGGG